MKAGPFPDQICSIAAAPERQAAMTSLLSTSNAGMPKGFTRSAILPNVAVSLGASSEYPLFSHTNSTGSFQRESRY